MGNLAAFLWTTLGPLLGFTGVTWKWQWDRCNPSDVLFEAFLKIPSDLVHEICGVLSLSRDLLCVWNKCCQESSPYQLGHSTASPASLQNRTSEELSWTDCIMCKAYGASSICWFTKRSPWFPILGNSVRICTAQSAVLDCRTYEASRFSPPKIICFASASEQKVPRFLLSTSLNENHCERMISEFLPPWKWSFPNIIWHQCPQEHFRREESTTSAFSPLLKPHLEGKNQTLRPAFTVR